MPGSLALRFVHSGVCTATRERASATSWSYERSSRTGISMVIAELLGVRSDSGRHRLDSVERNRDERARRCSAQDRGARSATIKNGHVPPSPRRVIPRRSAMPVATRV